jgi:sugar phosphate isomerase/epimerase
MRPAQSIPKEHSMATYSRRDFLRQAAATAGLGAGCAVLGSAAAGRLPTAEKPAALKFAICNETFRDWSQEKAFAFAAECGYTGIEIAPFTISTYVTDVDRNQRKALRKLADANGLQVTGLHWLLAKTEGLHLTSPDKDVRKATAKYLGELARFCADLGGKVMIFGSPQQRNLKGLDPPVSLDEGKKYAAEVFRAVVPALEKHDVTIGLEPLGPNETDIIIFAADAAELADMVDSPRVQMMLDCKACAKESAEIPDLIHKYHKRMVHFHANDTNRRGPGMGDLDFLPIFKALREVNYDRWVSVEVFDYEPGVERLARESIDYMKKVQAQLNGRASAERQTGDCPNFRTAKMGLFPSRIRQRQKFTTTESPFFPQETCHV